MTHPHSQTEDRARIKAELAVDAGAMEDAIITFAKAIPPSRESSLALTRLEEAFFWLRRAVEVI